MPGGGITGDASVKWFMEIDDARVGSTQINSQPGSWGRGLRQSGIEHKTKDDGDFKITIEIPDDRNKFETELQKALTDLRAGAPFITLSIRIRQRATELETESLPYQIRVEWDRATSSSNPQP